MSSIAENKAVVAEMDAIGNGSGDLTRLDALCAADMVTTRSRPGAHRASKAPVSSSARRVATSTPPG